MEPRAGTEENAGGQNTLRTLSRERVTHALARVRERSRELFVAKHPKWEPYRESRTYGSVRGRAAMRAPNAILLFFGSNFA